jgi:futalosine hydrolase
MNILLLSATPFEIEQTLTYLNEHWEKKSEDSWIANQCRIEILISGVGGFNTMFSLMHRLKKSTYSLVIQAGIGGSYEKNKPLGNVYYIKSERFGDVGIENQDGSFTSIFETNLMDMNAYPFLKGVLINPDAEQVTFLPLAHGITLNTVTGTNVRANKLKNHFPEVEIESMEGAPFFFVCLKERLPFMSIRSISNYVEDRNKEQWKINEAIISLNKTLQDLLTIVGAL